MIRRTLRLIALAGFLGAFTSAIAPAPAAAGCCACTGDCAPPVVVVEPTEVTQFYLVNRGPVLSGPGHYLRQSHDKLPPGNYPYVGTYYYPEDGGPYADPDVLHRKVHHRRWHGPVKVHVSSHARIIRHAAR